jgi:hypothetical protein
MVDGPLLPEDAQTESKFKPRYMPSVDALRVIAAVCALFGAIFIPVARVWEATHPPTMAPPGRTLTPYTPVSHQVFYGELASPAAAKPGPSPSKARTICSDETRWEPTHGEWHCSQTGTLGPFETARPARDPGGPCTHRTAYLSPVWNCVSRIPMSKAARRNGPIQDFFVFGGPRRGPDFCDQQSRISMTHGSWTCTNWRPIPPGLKLAKARVQPGPCNFRIADQQTGAWSCTPGAP